MAQRYPFGIIENGTTYYAFEGPRERSWNPARQSSTVTMGDGTGRRNVFFPLHLRERYPDALLPEERLIARQEYGWQAMSQHGEDLVAGWRWAPSTTLQLIEWGVPYFPTFTGDGVRRELRQYHVQANDALAELGAVPPRTDEDNRATPRVWVNGAEKPLAGVDQSTWDAGDPPAGEAWWLIGSKVWRLAEVPDIGVKIKTQYLPILEVVEDTGGDRSQSTRAGAQGIEPWRLVFVEKTE
jgi:hypothetical protein